MEQTVLKDQTIQFEDEDQVIESQSISILPPQTEEKSSLLEDSVTPEEETKNGVSTKIPRAKKYLKITDEQRRDFIDAVENKGEKIIHAAKLFDINYSSAKSILNIYKNEGRSTKKGTRTKTDNVSPKILETSEGLGSLPKTASVSTQTNEEDHQDSFLLLKDNLLLGSEKRSNPYDSISYHGVSRFTGNINDYSGSQLQNNFNQLPGFQNIIDPNNKPPQDYQPNQPIFTSINYISLPSAQNISAPNLQHPSQLSSLNPENNSLFKPAGFLYPQNTQALSPESGPPQLNQNLPGLNLLTSCGINQPLFSTNPQSLPTNLDYSQLQGFNLPSSGSLRQEVPLQNKEDYSSGLMNFASMSYTGGDNTMGQAQISQHQLPLQFNENNKGLFQQGKTEIRYLPPISMVYMPMPSNQYEQQNATIRPVFQMIGNYAPQQNTFAFYENNQNSNSNNQNHNNYPQNN